MKASMYFNYTTRSLLRGGQRTDIGCVLRGSGSNGNCRSPTCRVNGE